MISDIAAFAVVIGLIYFCWCLLRMIFSKSRRKVAVHAGVTFILIAACVVIFAYTMPQPSPEALAAQARAQAEAEAAEKAKVEATAKAEAASLAKKETDCRQQLDCWGERAATIARTDCPARIERQAKYDFEWQDDWTHPKFEKMAWIDKAQGIVAVFGDRLKLQNGFGAWQWVIYECAVNPAALTVTSINIRPGRL